MLTKAIEKIKDELEKNKGDDFIPAIGEFLIYHLGLNPASAEKILDEEKTIAKSALELWKAAEKKRKGKVAALSPQQWAEIVLKYFGIEGEVLITTPMSMNATKPIAEVVTPTAAIAKAVKPHVLDFNVDDFF